MERDSGLYEVKKNTRRFGTGGENLNESELKEAAGLIKRGGLVVFPTETVYGLGGNAKDSDAARKIYAAKGRPSDNPLIVHIAEMSQFYEVAERVPETAERLAGTFWPGPMTLIVKKNSQIPDETTGGLDTVAVRFPRHSIARALIRESGCMIAAPSANRSGRPSPTTADHAWEDLNGKVDAVIDGGPVEIGLESTIVDLTEEVPVILRPGSIGLDALRKAAGEVRMDSGILEKPQGKVRPKAPGMRYRHYAPKGNLIIVDGDCKQVAKVICSMAEKVLAEGKKVGIIASEETKNFYYIGNVYSAGSRISGKEVAHNLYALLRKMDELQVEQIYSESFYLPHIGDAIMNRLLKAAAYQVIRV